MSDEIQGRVSTGIPGLDDILEGGLLPRFAYLLRGGPGTGKTSIALQFLTEGARAGEPTLFIALSQAEDKIRAQAASLGVDMASVTVLDLIPTSRAFEQLRSAAFFAPTETGREPVTRQLRDTVERLHPTRVVLDSVSQLRFLLADPLQFRQQLQAFLRFLAEHGATVIITSMATPTLPDDDLQFISDGIINLEATSNRRFVQVTKHTGSRFRMDRHSMIITDEGVKVFPRLVPDVAPHRLSTETLSSGIRELDAQLHGGLTRGTSTFITGPSGVGKTLLGLTFAKEAAARGERTVVYTFDEDAEMARIAAEGVSIPIAGMEEAGTLRIVPIEPLRFTPDEFAAMVRGEVEKQDTRMIVIDSLEGYRLSLLGADLQHTLHALIRYLGTQGVTSLVTVETRSVTGAFRVTDDGISYLTDNIIFIRYLELNGELRRAIGVLKKRLTGFEPTLREFSIASDGIHIGPPLTGLRGILEGTPEPIHPEPGEERKAA